jgi:signal transduction histidine kinase
MNGEMVKISVADTGIGIDPQHHSAIFEKFAQVDGITHGGVGGTGLGLSIAKSFVERLGGEIGVESRPGEGATFWFTFPRRATRAAEAAPV